MVCKVSSLARDVHVGAAAIAVGTVVVKGRGYTTHGAGDNPTTETRLDALEKNVTAIHERISQTQNETDKEIANVYATVKHEEQLRQTDVTTVQKRLEVTATGGVHISAIGASWLFFGVILSHAAPEIVALSKSLFPAIVFAATEPSKPSASTATRIINWEVLLPLLITTFVAILGWYVAHRQSAARDRANKKRDVRVQYLIDAYRRLESAASRSPREMEKYADGFESAISDIGRDRRSADLFCEVG